MTAVFGQEPVCQAGERSSFESGSELGLSLTACVRPILPMPVTEQWHVAPARVPRFPLITLYFPLVLPHVVDVADVAAVVAVAVVVAVDVAVAALARGTFFVS
jgi:hypothetical protein